MSDLIDLIIIHISDLEQCKPKTRTEKTVIWYP